MFNKLPLIRNLILPLLIILLLFLIVKKDENFRWNTYASNFDFIAPYFDLKYAGTSGNYIDNSVLQMGAFEKPELMLLRNVTEGLNSTDLVFLDIGANTGLYSLFMSKYVESVHAIEPFPPILDKLKKNIEINKIQNITIHPLGFGLEDATIPFYPPPNNNQGMGSFAHEVSERVVRISEIKEMNLPIRNGDSYLKALNATKIDLVKLDIEGYEKLALIGLKETMSLNRPIVLMELNCNLPESFKDENDLISTYPVNYTFMEILSTLEGLYSGEYLLLPLIFDNTQKNILAFPNEKKALIESIQNSKAITLN